MTRAGGIPFLIALLALLSVLGLSPGSTAYANTVTFVVQADPVSVPGGPGLVPGQRQPGHEQRLQ
jgi:hypothetical protein